MITFLVLALPILLIGFIFLKDYNSKKYYKTINARYSNLPQTVGGFTYSKSYIHPRGYCLIGLDNEQKKVLLAGMIPPEKYKQAKKSNPEAQPIWHRVIHYQDIVKTEMLIDNQTVGTRSSAGALTGGLLLGTTGALIGDTMGKTVYRKDIQSIVLKMIVNDVMNPSSELLFFHKKLDKPRPPDEAKKQCENWHDTLSVVISN